MAQGHSKSHVYVACIYGVFMMFCFDLGDIYVCIIKLVGRDADFFLSPKNLGPR